MARTQLQLLLLLAATVAAAWLPSEALRVDKHDILQVGDTSTLDVEFPVGTSATYAIAHKYASYISVHFADFDLPVGDVVTVSSTSDAIKTAYNYTLTGRDARSTFIASFVPGSEVRVDYLPANDSVPSDRTAFRIDGYAWGLPSRNTESVCGSGDQAQPALCYTNGSELGAGLPLAYEKSQAVARLLINGSWFCTGFLAGSEGHIFTNAHCFDYDEEATTTDFEFGAESSSCADLCEEQLGCAGTVVATQATLLVRDEYLDYALLKLPKGTDTSAFGYLQFRETGPVKDEPIYVPQYPMGYAKRIASYSDDNSSTAVKAVNVSDVCGEHQVEHNAGTQQGASGSPLLSDVDNAVVGIHHCGGCNNLAIDVRVVLADLKSRNITIRDLVASPASTNSLGCNDDSASPIFQQKPLSCAGDSADGISTEDDGFSVVQDSDDETSMDDDGSSMDDDSADGVSTEDEGSSVNQGEPAADTSERTELEETAAVQNKDQSMPEPSPTPTPTTTTGKPTVTPCPATKQPTPAPTTPQPTPAPTTVKPTSTPTPKPTLTTDEPTPVPTTVKPTPIPTETPVPTFTPSPTNSCGSEAKLIL